MKIISSDFFPISDVYYWKRLNFFVVIHFQAYIICVCHWMCVWLYSDVRFDFGRFRNWISITIGLFIQICITKLLSYSIWNLSDDYNHFLAINLMFDLNHHRWIFEWKHWFLTCSEFFFFSLYKQNKNYLFIFFVKNLIWFSCSILQQIHCR